MTRVLRNECRAARKMYACDAYAVWNRCNMGLQDCVNDKDRLIVAAAEPDGGRILAGQSYRYVRAIGDDGPYTWLERIDMGSLCVQYDLYESD